jgi:hypothetical protein
LTYPNAARICDYLLGGAGVGDGGLVEGCHDLHGPGGAQVVQIVEGRVTDLGALNRVAGAEGEGGQFHAAHGLRPHVERLVSGNGGSQPPGCSLDVVAVHGQVEQDMPGHVR